MSRSERARTNGPDFIITTWRDAEGWHARLVPVETKGTLAGSSIERQACVGHGRRMLETAVRDAVAYWLRTWGGKNPGAVAPAKEE